MDLLIVLIITLIILSIPGILFLLGFHFEAKELDKIKDGKVDLRRYKR